MDLGLNGRTALITGGSKGIGYAIAEQLASEGCNLILIARTMADLERARDNLLRQYAVSVRIRAEDLSKESATLAVSAAFPEVDILVNNAGAIRHGGIEEVDDKLWRSYWDLKVFGYINLTRAYYALMKTRQRGVIINIIGAGGERLNAKYIAGASGNASLMAFTKALGGVSPDHGIRIIGLNPGSVLTEKKMMALLGEAKEKFGDSERWPELIKSMPFGRAIKPVEISSMVALLASDLSGYTSGTIVTIDGGASNRK